MACVRCLARLTRVQLDLAKAGMYQAGGQLPFASPSHQHAAVRGDLDVVWICEVAGFRTLGAKLRMFKVGSRRCR